MAVEIPRLDGPENQTDFPATWNPTAEAIEALAEAVDEFDPDAFDPAGAASSAAGAVADDLGAHEGLTTGAHGGIVASNDSRLTDARTPTSHAASHADGGSDEVALDGSQITTGTVATARLSVGSTNGTVAAGDDARLNRVPTPVGQSDGKMLATASDALVYVDAAFATVDAGDDLTLARPDAGVVYWRFEDGTDPGDAGENIVNAEPGDLWVVFDA